MVYQNTSGDNLWYNETSFTTLAQGWDADTGCFYLAGMATNLPEATPTDYTGGFWFYGEGDVYFAIGGVMQGNMAPDGGGSGVANNGLCYAGYPNLLTGFDVYTLTGFYIDGVYLSYSGYGQAPSGNWYIAGVNMGSNYTGPNTDQNTYIIDGVEMYGMDSGGNGRASDGWYYIGGVLATGLIYDASQDTNYWVIDGVIQSGLSNGNHLGIGLDNNGLFRVNGEIASGWFSSADGGTDIYYVDGIGTSLDITGTGVSDNLCYVGGITVGVAFTAITLPTAAQVQQGASYGYPGNTLTGTLIPGSENFGGLL